MVSVGRTDGNFFLQLDYSVFVGDQGFVVDLFEGYSFIWKQTGALRTILAVWLLRGWRGLYLQMFHVCFDSCFEEGVTLTFFMIESCHLGFDRHVIGESGGSFESCFRLYFIEPVIFYLCLMANQFTGRIACHFNYILREGKLLCRVFINQRQHNRQTDVNIKIAQWGSDLGDFQVEGTSELFHVILVFVSPSRSWWILFYIFRAIWIQNSYLRTFYEFHLFLLVLNDCK